MPLDKTNDTAAFWKSMAEVQDGFVCFFRILSPYFSHREAQGLNINNILNCELRCSHISCPACFAGRQEGSCPRPPQINQSVPGLSGSSFVPAREMLSVTLSAKILYLHCLCNWSVAFSPAWCGWGGGTQLYSAGRQTLKEGPLRIRDTLMVPQGWYLALQIAGRCKHSVFEHRQE